MIKATLTRPDARMPDRRHVDDAGADLTAVEDAVIPPLSVAPVPLGLSVEIPNGFMGLVLPRSSCCARGLSAEPTPIDAGYRGEIHAFLANRTAEPIRISKGERIAQLVIAPVDICGFYSGGGGERGGGWLGSTGR